MKITAKTKICMVIGDPVEHSLSPQMHNASYQALGIDEQYVYVACKVGIKNIENFIKGVRAMNIRGISCTVPHKIAVMPYLDEIDEIARKIGAVNTIVNDNGNLTGYNTDWIGVSKPLGKIINIENKIVALIGAGGAAKAIAYAVTNKKAKLTVYNRTFKKAEELVKEFGGSAYSLDDIKKIKDADIIINTTSVGLENKNDIIIPKDYLSDLQIVFDIVYGTEETKLIKDAKEKGAKTISGIEMLLYQGVEQFKLFTNTDAPIEAMRKALQ